MVDGNVPQKLEIGKWVLMLITDLIFTKRIFFMKIMFLEEKIDEIIFKAITGNMLHSSISEMLKKF